MHRKIISKTLETHDMQIAYSPNPNELVQKELDKKFKGKCYNEIFIMEIAILRRGPFITDFERNGGGLLYPVTFEARGIYYNPGDIIVGSLANVLDEHLMFDALHTVILLKNDPRLQHLKTGDKLPIKITESAYPPGKNIISAVGVPFVPEQEEYSPWQVTITDSDVEVISKLTPPEIDEKTKAILYKMYPYKSRQSLPGTIVPLHELKAGNYIISKPQCLENPWEILVNETKEKIQTTPAKNLLRTWAANAKKYVDLARELGALPESSMNLYYSLKLSGPPATGPTTSPKTQDHA